MKENKEADTKVLCRALVIEQPYADLLTRPVSQDAVGNWIAGKETLIRPFDTDYRGDVLLCSASVPKVEGRLCGMALGLVELYQTKPTELMTDEEIAAGCNPDNERYAWSFRNPRRVVEFPVNAARGFYEDMAVEELCEYPRAMAFGKEGWEEVQKIIKKSKYDAVLDDVQNLAASLGAVNVEISSKLGAMSVEFPFDTERGTLEGIAMAMAGRFGNRAKKYRIDGKKVRIFGKF